MKSTIDRRCFLGNALKLGTGSLVLPLMRCTEKSSTVAESKRFFTVDKRNGRWWLVTPQNEYIFSIGMNHVDPAAIRFTYSDGIWDSKYGNNMKEWLPKVKQDLTDWGFNCMGWDQEVVIIRPEMHRHSRCFTYEEYQWLDMPYFHLLPIIESHQWEWETKLPDITGSAFKDWCDYVARDKCARLKDDPKLVGYFFTDCPAWIHSNDNNSWKAPIFDPEMENSESGRKEIYEKATIYYKTVVEAIRRYDPNHLICGDRYEANAPISESVLKAAMPYTDIFSFQCFGSVDNIYQKLSHWGQYLKKPILLADSMISREGNHGWPPTQDLTQDDEDYGEVMKALRTIPECMGFHLCGAYIKNNARRYGLLDQQDQEEPTTQGIKKANLEQMAWVKEQVI
jgi:hypothetical protein